MFKNIRSWFRRKDGLKSFSFNERRAMIVEIMHVITWMKSMLDQNSGEPLGLRASAINVRGCMNCLKKVVITLTKDATEEEKRRLLA